MKRRASVVLLLALLAAALAAGRLSDAFTVSWPSPAAEASGGRTLCEHCEVSSADTLQQPLPSASSLQSATEVSALTSLWSDRGSEALLGFSSTTVQYRFYRFYVSLLRFYLFSSVDACFCLEFCRIWVQDETSFTRLVDKLQEEAAFCCQRQRR